MSRSRRKVERSFEGGYGIKALGKRDKARRETEPESVAEAVVDVATVLVQDRRRQVLDFLQANRGTAVTLGTVQIWGDCLKFSEVWAHLFPGVPVPIRSVNYREG
jgi:hypothetical protein